MLYVQLPSKKKLIGGDKVKPLTGTDHVKKKYSILVLSNLIGCSKCSSNHGTTTSMM